jgi:hypothetical protein
MAELRRLAKPLLADAERARNQREFELLDRAKSDAHAHAAHFSLIAAFGRPDIAEPLSEAWLRCRNSDAPGLSALKDAPYLTPFDDTLSLRVIADLFTRDVLPHLPGADEKEKFNRIFETAPPWLIRFTDAHWTALLLDLKLPNISEVRRYKRTRNYFIEKWPLLPSGVFEGVRWTDAEWDEHRRDLNKFAAEHPTSFTEAFFETLEWKYHRNL